MGAAVLLQAAAQEPTFEAIVAESSFADIQDAAEHRLKKMLPLPRPLATPFSWIAAVNARWYTRLVYGFDLAETSPLKAIARIKAPILLIHGTADDQTPPDHSQRLAAANPRWTKLWLVEGAQHCGAYAREPQEFEHRVLAWFQEH
jgi:dipeptidyl aminopeptidase/acylaminoacyl peptidase